METAPSKGKLAFSRWHERQSFHSFAWLTTYLLGGIVIVTIDASRRIGKTPAARAPSIPTSPRKWNPMRAAVRAAAPRLPLIPRSARLIISA